MEEMREIRAAAEAYYKNGDTNTIESARKFFRDLDKNGDERVSVAEFMHFLSKNSYNPLMRTPAFFRKLDQDGDDELDFNDVCTLFYIIVTKRQFCEGCGDFLKGLLFTCVKCYDDSKQNTYNLCSSCFGGGNGNSYFHDHKNIIDNYLLHTERRGSSSRPEPAPNSHPVTVAVQPAVQEPSNLQLAQVVQGHRIDIFTVMVEFLGKACHVVGVEVANAAANGCSIL